MLTKKNAAYRNQDTVSSKGTTQGIQTHQLGKINRKKTRNTKTAKFKRKVREIEKQRKF